MKFPTADPRGVFASVFVPEWLGLAAIIVVAMLWARLIDFHISITTRDFHVFAAVIASMALLRLFGQKRGALMAEFLALTLAMAMVFTVLSYLSMAVSLSLADRQLLAIDHALGFDWLAGWHFLTAHPLGLKAANLLYNSLTWQALYLCLFLGLMARKAAMRELFWLLFVSALLTDLIAIVLPAYGPFEIFGLASHAEFLPDMKYLKSGAALNFELGKMTGVISFPSFHTVMALCYAYGARKTGIIGHIVAAMNILMLFTVPFIGGHYLIDMIAGAGVMLLALAIVTAIRKLPSNAAATSGQSVSAESVSPECAARSGGAC